MSMKVHISDTFSSTWQIQPAYVPVWQPGMRGFWKEIGRRPYWYNFVIYFNPLLQNLFQLLWYLIRVFLDREHHAASG